MLPVVGTGTLVAGADGAGSATRAVVSTRAAVSRTAGFGVPEQIGVVVKDRVPADGHDLELAGRQGIVLAAGRDRREEDDGPVRTRRAQRRLLTRDLDRDVGGGRIARRLPVRIERLHAGHADLAARGHWHSAI